jgi:predicted LPLAT superfamily acyltransferase
MIGIVRWLGRPVARALLHPIAAYFLLTDPGWRRASRGYFARLVSSPEGRAALGHAPGWRDGYRQMYEFATSLFDRMCVWAGEDAGFRFEHRAAEHFEHLPDAGGANPLGKRGGLILGAHLGTFDVMRSLCLKAGVPVAVVLYGENAETINTFFAALDPAHGMHLIHVRPGAAPAALEIRSAVERGEFVAIMGDRPGLGSRATHAVPFLGAPARFSEGPLQLALLIGCPVLMATAVRIGDETYRVDSEPLYGGGFVPRAERQKLVHELIERYARYLERACLRTPHQWFNFFDFWQGA